MTEGRSAVEGRTEAWAGEVAPPRAPVPPRPGLIRLSPRAYQWRQDRIRASMSTCGFGQDKARRLAGVTVAPAWAHGEERQGVALASGCVRSASGW